MFNNQQQFSATPLASAFGDLNRPHNPNPYPNLPQNPDNSANILIGTPLALIGNPIPNTAAYPINMENQLSVPLNPNMQLIYGAPPMQSGTIYYGDQDSQTCTNIKGYIEQPNQIPSCLVFWNIFLIIGLIGGFILYSKFNLFIWSLAQIVGIPYILYLIFTCCNNPFSTYFSTMKDYSQLQIVYRQLQNKTGHIKLWVQCYHFTGVKRRRKTISHTAVQIIPVRQCIDASQQLFNLKGNNSFLFCKFKKYFYFADQNSHNIFINAYSIFKLNQKKDTYQNFTHSLDIAFPNFCSQMGFGNSGACLKPMYIIFTVLGLCYPYVKLINCMSQKYSINIIKKITI